MKKNLAQFTRLKWLMLFFIIIASSCADNRNLVYFSDLKNQNTDSYTNINKALVQSEPKIQPNDLLNIRVTTLSPESNALFNNNIATNMNINNNTTEPIRVGYRVDKDGNISFPVIGQVKLSELTVDQAQDVITKKLEVYTKGPVVNIDFLNFKITVIGEVNKPGTFTVDDENISLLGALGLAGDMTPYAKRDNVLIVRETNGVRTTERINLNKSELFDSKYYYLKQNDVVYVEPDKSRLAQTSENNRFIPIVSASVAIVAVLLTIFLKR
jgi:polysaccharide export outer membrane protein